MRFGYSSSCGLLSLLLSAFPWAAFGEETSELALPTWRVQAGAFTSGFGQSLGVYHRLSNGWDWGFEVATNFSESDNDDDRVGTSSGGLPIVEGSSHDDESFSVNLDFDVRRWGRVQERLAWFFGPRVGGTFGKGSEKFRLEQIAAQNRVEVDDFDTRWYSINAGFIVGADLELLKNLSATFALLPLSLDYRWTDRDSKSVNMVDGVIVGTSEADSDDNTFRVETGLLPSIYLTLAID